MKRVLLQLLFSSIIFGVSFAQPEQPLLQRGDADLLSLLSWSPNDDLILTSTGEENSLRLWEVRSGKVRWKSDVGFLQEGLELYSLRHAAWTKDQTLVATGSDNGKIQLWDTATGKLIWNIKAHAGVVSAISISPDAKRLVSAADLGDWKSELKIWQLSDGKLIKDLSARQKDIVAIRFINEQRFQTGNGFGQIITWSIESFTPVATKQLAPCGVGTSKRTRVFYSPNFALMAAQCQKQIVLTNITTGKAVKRIADETQDKQPLFSQDDTVRFFTDSIHLEIFDANGNRIKDSDGNVMDGGVLSNDGSLLAMSASYRADGVEIFATQTMQRQGWLIGHPGVIKSLAFSPDGSRFASGSADRIVRIWDTESKQIISSLTGHTDEVESIAFSDDGKSLVSQSEKETIVWNLETGGKRKETKADTRFEEGKNSLSPSGKFALIEEHEKPFRLVDARTNQTIKEFVFIDQLDDLIFCPDEKHFLAKPWWRGWQLWSVESNEPMREFDVGYSFHNRVAFHPNGRIFITGGSGQNIFMFDLESGKMLWSLFPIDQQEYAEKKAHETRRVAYIKREEEKARLADIENEKYKNQIYITFSHYGEMIDPGQLRLAESDRPNKSRIKKPTTEANAVWLRLHNDSPLPISVPTQSMYFWGAKCSFTFASGQKISGLCNNREIAVWHGLEDKDGNALRYGFDFGSSTILLPKTSVLFAVPRALLQNGQAIYFGVTFQNESESNKIENYGTPIILKFGDKNLPTEK